jgi:hypothetical protein
VQYLIIGENITRLIHPTQAARLISSVNPMHDTCLEGSVFEAPKFA